MQHMGRRTTLLRPPQFGICAETLEDIQSIHVDSMIGHKYVIIS